MYFILQGRRTPIVRELYGDSLLTVFLFRKDGDTYRPSGHSQTSDRLKKEASVKADCCAFGYGTHMNC